MNREIHIQTNRSLYFFILSILVIYIFSISSFAFSANNFFEGEKYVSNNYSKLGISKTESVSFVQYKNSTIRNKTFSASEEQTINSLKGVLLGNGILSLGDYVEKQLSNNRMIDNFVNVSSAVQDIYTAENQHLSPESTYSSEFARLGGITALENIVSIRNSNRSLGSYLGENFSNLSNSVNIIYRVGKFTVPTKAIRKAVNADDTINSLVNLGEKFEAGMKFGKAAFALGKIIALKGSDIGSDDVNSIIETLNEVVNSEELKSSIPANTSLSAITEIVTLLENYSSVLAAKSSLSEDQNISSALDVAIADILYKIANASLDVTKIIYDAADLSGKGGDTVDIMQSVVAFVRDTHINDNIHRMEFRLGSVDIQDSQKR